MLAGNRDARSAVLAVVVVADAAVVVVDELEVEEHAVNSSVVAARVLSVETVLRRCMLNLFIAHIVCTSYFSY